MPFMKILKEILRRVKDFKRVMTNLEMHFEESKKIKEKIGFRKLSILLL
jgi:hypothetical protein